MTVFITEDEPPRGQLQPQHEHLCNHLYSHRSAHVIIEPHPQGLGFIKEFPLTLGTWVHKTKTQCHRPSQKRECNGEN